MLILRSSPAEAFPLALFIDNLGVANAIHYSMPSAKTDYQGFACRPSRLRSLWLLIWWGPPKMRHQRIGEICCYLKLSLLRALSPGMQLGIAWYLVPDVARRSMGIQTGYLDLPDRWRDIEPVVFDTLADLVRSGQRSLPALHQSGIISAVHATDLLDYEREHWPERFAYRTQWFNRVLADLADCDLVFADPEMGLIETGKPLRADHAMRMTAKEAQTLAQGRTAIILHRNSLRLGGQDAEVDYWLSQFGANAFAIRAKAYHAITFFMINPTPAIKIRAIEFCARWQDLNAYLQCAPPLPNKLAGQ